MNRLACLLTVLALSSVSNAGDEPRKVFSASHPGGVAPTHGVVHSSPCPDGRCAESAPRGLFGLGLLKRPLIGSHECGPDGCLNPIGCGNFHTDFKFVFGSCRSFFGNAAAIPPLVKP
jgi:hypothetical protein